MTFNTLYSAQVNSPDTTLSSGIDDSVTTIPVTELGVFPAGPNLAVIGKGNDAETILYTDKSAASGAGNLTGVTRAYDSDGTYGVASAWIKDTVISRNFTSHDWDTIKNNAEDLNTRLQPGSTDNRIIRADGTGNATIQGSSVVLDDDGRIYIDDGNNNVVFGEYALNANTSGQHNISLGYRSLFLNDDGDDNVAIGENALFSNTEGRYNVAVGAYSLYSTTTADSNVAVGYYALRQNAAEENVAVGNNALYSNTYGGSNTAVGHEALQYSKTNNYLTAIGAESLANQSGDYNVGVGYKALKYNSSATSNIGIGNRAGYYNSNSYNIAIGDESLYYNSGINNTTVGHYSLKSVATADNNTAVGYCAGYNDNQLATASNSIMLGANTFTDRSNQVVIGDENVVETQLRTGVYVGSTSATAHTQPTAKLHIAAGSASAGTAPLKLTSGTNLTSPEAGAIEYDGTYLYFTDSDSTRRTISFGWSEVTGTTQSCAVNTGYILNNASLVTATLPATASVGDVIRIVGKGAGMWKLEQNASQYIRFAGLTTTTGTGGYLQAETAYDCIEIMCTTANNGWTVISSIGNILVV